MKKLIFLVGVLLPVWCFSQDFHLTLFGGFANYQGDLQEKRISLDQSYGAIGAGLRYDINRHFAARAGFVYGTIGADDKKNGASLQPRNLNFKSGLLEGNLLLEYNVLDLTYHRLTPYFFGGISIFHFNPYTYDTLGNKILLQPLGTEGQGLAAYPDRKMYRLTRFGVPFGGGIKLRISRDMVLGYEIGLRKTFTDYLDDVSTTYADATLLATERGPKAVEMAYRGGELKNGNPAYPAEGTKRGGAAYDDWYYFHGITLSIRLNGLNRKRGSQLDCPVNVR